MSSISSPKSTECMSPGLLLPSPHDSLALSWSSGAGVIVATLLSVGQSDFCIAVKELSQNPTPRKKIPTRITAGKFSEHRLTSLLLEIKN